jgi:hypothetical protein
MLPPGVVNTQTPVPVFGWLVLEEEKMNVQFTQLKR